MIRIWLNHWFSTAYSIINLIKEDEKEFYVIGSSDNVNSVVKCACDEWYQEPDLKGEEYVQYCVKFCKEHKIDIFMPRKGMLEISENIHLFHEIGTKVMVDAYEKISLLNHKDQAYELFKEKKIGIVPDYEIVTTPAEFSFAYEKLSGKYEQICFKFVHDEGGRSFRIIDNHTKGHDDLFKIHRTRMTFDEVMKVLEEREKFEPVMLMPYLPGDEVSVDCLKTMHGVIMLPRIKDVTRIERIKFDDRILAMCEDFYNKVGLEYPCNIQFKYLDEIPYFLEVNTRMSGGVQMSCLAAGVNIPNLAVNKILGTEKEWQMDKTEKFVSYVETPIIVSKRC